MDEDGGIEFVQPHGQWELKTHDVPTISVIGDTGQVELRIDVPNREIWVHDEERWPELAQKFWQELRYIAGEPRPDTSRFLPTPVQHSPYQISRDLLARMVAAHTSGVFNAIPEQADYDNADAMIALLESRLRE